MTIIEDLRKPKIKILDKEVALFDVTLTGIGGYYISKYLNISPIVGIPAMFLFGHGVHKVFKIKTQFS